MGVGRAEAARHDANRVGFKLAIFELPRHNYLLYLIQTSDCLAITISDANRHHSIYASLLPSAIGEALRLLTG